RQSQRSANPRRPASASSSISRRRAQRQRRSQRRVIEYPSDFSRTTERDHRRSGTLGNVGVVRNAVRPVVRGQPRGDVSRSCTFLRTAPATSKLRTAGDAAASARNCLAHPESTNAASLRAAMFQSHVHLPWLVGQHHHVLEETSMATLVVIDYE